MRRPTAAHRSANRRRRWLRIGVALMVGMAAAEGIAKWLWDARCFAGYDRQDALRLETRELSTTADAVHLYLRYRSAHGETVPALLDIPRRGRKPCPVVIFLHGIGQKKEFLNDIAEYFVRAGFAIICFDQLGRGERASRDSTVITFLPDLRRRCAQTVLDVRRTIDCLEQIDGIDAGRIHLVGASLGAIIGVAAAAQEPRVSDLTLIYGGGDIGRMLADNELLGTHGWKGRLFGLLGAWVLRPIEPLRHIRRVAPRPLLMLNGRADRVIPPTCAQALYDRALEPKRIVWYPGDHIGGDIDVVHSVLRQIIGWLRERQRQA